MADYKEMYYTLFAKVATAIEALQEAQRETELMFMTAEDPEIRLLDEPDTGGPDTEDEDP
jgi:hypothetical protein